MVTLSGKPDNTSKLFTSATNLMIVKFRTDASVEKTGFRGSWKIGKKKQLKCLPRVNS